MSEINSENEDIKSTNKTNTKSTDSKTEAEKVEVFVSDAKSKTKNSKSNKNKKKKNTVLPFDLGTLLSRFTENSKSMKLLLICLGAFTALSLFISLYFTLLPFTFYSGALKFYIIFLLLVWSIPFLCVYMNKKVNNGKLKDVKPIFQIPFWTACGLAVIFILLSLFTSPLILAKNYRNLITVNEGGNFVTEVADFTQMKIPVVDKALAMKLGDKKLGEDNLGSQYTIDDYTMIEYKEDLYWVGAIEHDGFFKWASNKSSPGYILISATNPNMNVQIIKKAIKYMPSAYFGQDLERKFYFNNMGLMLDSRINFELDEDGNPWYVQSVIKKEFAATNGDQAYGIVVLNASSGKYYFYKNGKEPDWIDRVYPTELINKQLNYWGNYKHGYFNTWFAKKELLNVTDGYNYIYNNGELCLYTGLTSTGSDESIVGIILSNLKTKQTTFYKISGATEFAARSSAEGVVQDLKYYSTFPCLINYGGQATYFMALKDNEGLIKKYAYVNVADYTKVGVGDTMVDAQVNYNRQINITIDYETLTIDKIRQVTIDGTSTYYITFVEKPNQVFKANIKLNDKLPFLTSLDIIKVRISEQIISEIIV